MTAEVSLFNDQLNDTTTFATGLFHDGVGQANFEGGDGAAVGLTSRLTASPILEGDGEQVLHIGLVLSERLQKTVLLSSTSLMRHHSSIYRFNDLSICPNNSYSSKLSAAFQHTDCEGVGATVDAGGVVRHAHPAARGRVIVFPWILCERRVFHYW